MQLVTEDDFLDHTARRNVKLRKALAHAVNEKFRQWYLAQDVNRAKISDLEAEIERLRTANKAQFRWLDENRRLVKLAEKAARRAYQALHDDPPRNNEDRYEPIMEISEFLSELGIVKAEEKGVLSQ